MDAAHRAAQRPGPECSFKPKIRKLAGAAMPSEPKPAEERLFNDAKARREKLEKARADRLKATCPFAPTRNKKDDGAPLTGEEVSEKLYNEAASQDSAEHQSI